MNILIALDGSPNANECLKDLVHFPMTGETRVHLVVVCDESLLSPHKIDQAHGQLIIENARSVITSSYPNIAVSSELCTGPTQAQILQASNIFCADLILAGAHAPRPFPAELLGSVAAHLAQHADCSVRLLRRGSNQNRVLVGLEHTEIDQAVVAEITKLQWPEGSDLMLLNMLDVPPIELSYNPREDARLYYSMQQQQKTVMLGLLEGYIAEIKTTHPNLKIETMISEEVEPAADILAFAKTWSATTIMVGSHRRKGQDKFWLGSVSEPVAAMADCSVHIVRHSPTAQK